MALLSYPDSDHLLCASLESLHAESVEWCDELDFWNEEVKFLYRLLKHRRLATDFPTEEKAAIEKELIRIKGERIAQLASGVASHKRLLASAYKSVSLIEEQVYRESHRKLRDEMNDLQLGIRQCKRKVFAFVKDDANAPN